MSEWGDENILNLEVPLVTFEPAQIKGVTRFWQQHWSSLIRAGVQGIGELLIAETIVDLLIHATQEDFTKWRHDLIGSHDQIAFFSTIVNHSFQDLINNPHISLPVAGIGLAKGLIDLKRGKII